MEQPDPVPGTPILGLANDPLPVHLVEEGTAGPSFGIGGVDFQCRDHVIGIAGRDFDDAFEPPGSREGVAQGVGKAG